MSTRIMQQIDIIKTKFNEADAIVIGAGSGLTASAGIDYTDVEFFARKYNMFLKKGYRTIWDGISDNWQLTKDNATTYWGYWANHINNVFYDPEQLETYRQLYQLIKNKRHYIITTNADGQFFKGNFDHGKIFAMQGSYGYFQCQKGCHNDIYINRAMISKMLEGFDDDILQIRPEDVPHCPKCGELLCPNLRVDQYFVENKHMVNKDKYIDFINSITNEKVVFLELGVGFNTPVIIRYPFERMTQLMKKACLIRVNKGEKDSVSITDKLIVTDMDISEVIRQMAEKNKY